MEEHPRACCCGDCSPDHEDTGDSWDDDEEIAAIEAADGEAWS